MLLLEKLSKCRKSGPYTHNNLISQRQARLVPKILVSQLKYKLGTKQLTIKHVLGTYSIYSSIYYQYHKIYLQTARSLRYLLATRKIKMQLQVWQCTMVIGYFNCINMTFNTKNELFDHYTKRNDRGLVSATNREGNTGSALHALQACNNAKLQPLVETDNRNLQSHYYICNYTFKQKLRA